MRFSFLLMVVALPMQMMLHLSIDWHPYHALDSVTGCEAGTYPMTDRPPDGLSRVLGGCLEGV